MATVDRMSRVNNLLQQTVAEILERDSLLKEFGLLVTVSQVTTSVNLRKARIGISFLGGTPEKQLKALNYLRRRHAVFQKEMTKSVTLKYTPRFEFYQDSTVESADNVLKILQDTDDNE